MEIELAFQDFEEQKTLSDSKDFFLIETSSKQEIKKFIEKFNIQEKDLFLNQFKRLLDDSNFEYGFSNPAEHYVREALSNYGLFVRNWISEIFIENLSNEKRTSSILKILMHLDSEELGCQGVSIALAALSHKSNAVREDAIRVFENWENPNYITALKSISCSEEWLQEMLEEVIAYLESL